MVKRIGSVLILFLFTAALFASEKTPIVVGENISMMSETLGEERHMQIYLPRGYENSDIRYPVIYLLDGPGHFHHTLGIVKFLAQNNRMPDLIVVAIANTDRTRDLTPTNEERFPTSGGAANFATFISSELMPHIEKEYRTHPYKILIGHSFGGLFANYVFLNQPEIFNAYISVSPSLWWKERELVKQAEETFANTEKLPSQFFMTMGNEGGDMLPSAQAFEDVLKNNNIEGLEHKFVHFPEETHGSVVHKSIYDGLEMIYSPWRLTGNLNEMDWEGLESHYKMLSERYRYTIEIPEAQVNNLGYALLGNGNMQGAIAVFQKNVMKYPNSANVYDSLGEAYERNEQLTLAKANYSKAVAQGSKINDPNLNIYQTNLDRVLKALSAN